MNATLRRSQLISTWGPGALLDLPDYAVIVGGLDQWPFKSLEEIHDPRLAAKLKLMTRASNPRLYAPPIDPREPNKKAPGITVYRFPEWFVVREDTRRKEVPPPHGRPSFRARRLVHRRQLQKGRFESCDVVPTRFVRACRRGHVADLDWYEYVHRGKNPTCHQQLWLDESGTGGEIGDLTVKCECGAQRSMFDATQYKERALGTCPGTRPWLGADTRETCTEPARLLIRTATNAYFPQVVTALSLPNRGTDAEKAVREHWTKLSGAKSVANIPTLREVFDDLGAALAGFSDQDVFAAIEAVRGGGIDDRPVKLVELDAILAAEEGFGDDVPPDPDFHARRLPEHIWRKTPATEHVASVVQLHRLRIVSALAGFTRFEAETPDIQGEYESDVQRANLAIEPTWFPAIEIRGEGIFLQIAPDAIQSWLDRPAVKARVEQLEHGFKLWMEKRQRQGVYPGATYVMLHTLSHLVMQALSMHAGYPASSIAERVYVDEDRKHYGILLYTGSNDADGTLGGLVDQAKHIGARLEEAIRAAALCSNDPICAQHEPDDHHEDRWLHGASCHGCTLIAETSCEMRNDHLDRALVVPVLGADPATAFFDPVP
ncbi:MAG: DUF1998 domain-containing protein [Deferrisomatales bacterium]|nr:DUF1998 domain-containing protein [Deferrisomatales bacterium]